MDGEHGESWGGYDLSPAGKRVRQILQAQMDEILGPGQFDVGSVKTDGDLQPLLEKLEDLDPAKAARCQEECDNMDMDLVRQTVVRILECTNGLSAAGSAMSIAMALASIAAMAKGLGPDYYIVGAIASAGWREMAVTAKQFKADKEGE
jgi:hypothetical protein